MLVKVGSSRIMFGGSSDVVEIVSVENHTVFGDRDSDSEDQTHLETEVT